MLDVNDRLEPLQLTEFQNDGRVYTLRHPVTITVEYSEGIWTFENLDLSIMGYSERKDEALRDLHRGFDYQYQDIALQDESRLEGGGRELRKRLLQLVSSVSTGPTHAKIS